MKCKFFPYFAKSVAKTHPQDRVNVYNKKKVKGSAKECQGSNYLRFWTDDLPSILDPI